MKDVFQIITDGKHYKIIRKSKESDTLSFPVLYVDFFGHLRLWRTRWLWRAKWKLTSLRKKEEKRAAANAEWKILDL